ncbi:hypothetical protein [Acinetobacter haemolyticus]|uniref:hypothetical protein n=1 Tax=Acinetobacter haemolyticus TaxID=29430 RepID=UPI0030094937
MKMFTPIEKGMAEANFQRIEKFKIHFSKTEAFELLIEQIQALEIFEMNNGKFVITTVQQAFEEWLSELKPTPRTGFIKDLDKLRSGDYVLVPRTPTQEMIVSALAVISTGLGKDQIIAEVTKTWEKMIEAAQGTSR